jgi:hypothetical protein
MRLAILSGLSKHGQMRTESVTRFGNLLEQSPSEVRVDFAPFERSFPRLPLGANRPTNVRVRAQRLGLQGVIEKSGLNCVADVFVSRRKHIRDGLRCSLKYFGTAIPLD